MKIYFYGSDKVDPDVVKDALSVFYDRMENMNKPPLFPGSPVIYIAVRDIDGDVVYLTDSDDPDKDLSWEVRNTERQSEKSKDDLVYKDEKKNIFIYQHYESRQKARY